MIFLRAVIHVKRAKQSLKVMLAESAVKLKYNLARLPLFFIIITDHLCQYALQLDHSMPQTVNQHLLPLDFLHKPFNCSSLCANLLEQPLHFLIEHSICIEDVFPTFSFGDEVSLFCTHS